ncbi:MAG: winged helix-turn-helix transcriptional regulator [Candidatus Marsarchaeota archaeon]|jgi:DNA-binding HxlR family transcriptional regulator|nr:winged helix-turn-helix transcriptional regulator [Candidatus Marsarchaeota archaeon]
MPRLDECPVIKMTEHGIKQDTLLRLAESINMRYILKLLARGPLNYSSMYRKLELNPKTLVSLLNELVKTGFVKKKIVNYKPMAVSYSITAAGRKAILSDCPFLECEAGAV